ncbi:IS66 family insertion sequence element accessory protein TnpA [Vibrio sp. PID23_8]|uniref:IS66 family insertion sequence element accessory protein TnpA n=1 Tax=Vibrio sp. PID23_8 TaxID=1583767 RepID=UPI000E6956BB|nr:hypothetical protein [Vibrio sp. PID23_8]RIZ54466.1 hypothetical protein AK966_08550 [Vibrio sp. PID23_8]
MTHKDKNHLWQERFQQQKDSGITINEWCEQHQLSVQTFYYWQKKLTAPKEQVKSVIVPLPAITPQSPIVIETPTGYRVSVSDRPALSLLPQLLQLLA